MRRARCDHRRSRLRYDRDALAVVPGDDAGAHDGAGCERVLSRRLVRILDAGATAGDSKFDADEAQQEAKTADETIMKAKQQLQAYEAEVEDF